MANPYSLFDSRIYRELEIHNPAFKTDASTQTEGKIDTLRQIPYDDSIGNGEYSVDSIFQEYVQRPDQIGAEDTQNDPDVVKAKNDQLTAIERMKGQARNYKATASLMNPYAVTRLYGAEGGKYLVDRYDQRKYYELDGLPSGHYATDPTTANIIKWGAGDKFGRTPYSFQDFVFCKYWNIIPNNRLITLRRYASPTYDNLNFPGMENGQISTHPIATALTYFGEGTDNTLSDLISFSAGIPWQDLQSDNWTVTGNAPTMDKVAKGSGFDKFGQSSAIVNMATLSGLLSPQDGTGNVSFDKHATKGLPQDPYRNGQYANRLIGPVNQIDKVKKRAQEGDNNKPKGLEFEMNSLQLKFHYVSRPISGINNKAILLDLMANMLVMCYASACFFGGMHRFMINPVEYPFTDDKARRKLWNGEVVGKDGAADTLMTNFTKKLKDGTGGGSVGDIFGTLGGMLTNMLSKAMGAIGLDQTGLGQWLSGKAANTSDSAKNASGNLEDQIASSIQRKMGTIDFLNGMRATLTGEPVGDWYLVIGNPLNPIVQIGNLVCSKIEFKFDDELGPDDFPIGFVATVTLEHGMPRDRDGIEAMFNRGAGRIYSLPDRFASSADGQTVVDAFTSVKGKGPFRWTDGYPTPAKSRQGTNGTTNEKAAYPDAYKTIGFPTPNFANTVNVKDEFYAGDMKTVTHIIMPWQTKIVL